MINRYTLFAVLLCCALLLGTFPASPSFGCIQANASESGEQTPTPSSVTPAEPETAEPSESSPDYTLLILAVAIVVLLLYFVFGGGK